DLRDKWVLDERKAGLGSEPCDDVDHARRDAGLLDELHELEERRRRELGRLDYDRVAGGQRGRELPRREKERRIPRNDRGDDAKRFIPCVVEGVGFVGREDRALDLV